MDRWVGRVALVTGASTGIGFAIAKELVKLGLKVAACARNIQTIEVTPPTPLVKSHSRKQLKA